MTRLTEETKSLKRILDLWDRWESLLHERRNARDDSDLNLALSDDSKIEAIARDILGEIERGGGKTLVHLRTRHRLGPEEIFIVLLLLKQALSDSNSWLKGRRILHFFHSSSFDLLRATRHLDPSAPLRAYHIIEVAAEQVANNDLLDVEFKLADGIFERFRRDVEVSSATNDSLRGYADNLEYLLDLKRLAMLYRRRALHVFRGDDWDEPQTPPREIELAIREHRERLVRRLTATVGAERLAAAHFGEKHRLSEEEMVIVVTLLFQGLHSGNGLIEAVDLVKLVCRSDRDLVEKRHLLSDKGALVSKGIVVLEESASCPEFPAEMSLAPWAAEAALGDAAECRRPEILSATGIDADAKLDFHEYLKGIEDSTDFFRKLRLPPGHEA